MNTFSIGDRIIHKETGKQGTITHLMRSRWTPTDYSIQYDDGTFDTCWAYYLRLAETQTDRGE